MLKKGIKGEIGATVNGRLDLQTPLLVGPCLGNVMNEFTGKLRCLFCGLNEECGEEHTLSDEHIIPQVLGGWVTIPFVCTHCNNVRFGRAFEAKLKKNAYVVVALEQLDLQKRVFSQVSG
jgi:hypothetical protein